jgi:hypothetical protein
MQCRMVIATYMRVLAQRYTTSPSAFDRRRTPRRAVRHVGVILTEPTEAPQYCIVTEESDGGVRIHTTANFQAPSEFTLRFADTKAKYRAVWRKGHMIGAELLVSPEHVGAPHSRPR